MRFKEEGFVSIKSKHFVGPWPLLAPLAPPTLITIIQLHSTLVKLGGSECRGVGGFQNLVAFLDWNRVNFYSFVVYGSTKICGDQSPCSNILRYPLYGTNLAYKWNY